LYERRINKKKEDKKETLGRAVVAHAFNPSTREAEAGRLLSSRTARAIQRNSVSKNKTKNKTKSQVVVANDFNPSTWEAEAGGFLSSRPVWSTE
jgi:hypothetical protein